MQYFLYRYSYTHKGKVLKEKLDIDKPNSLW